MSLNWLMYLVRLNAQQSKNERKSETYEWKNRKQKQICMTYVFELVGTVFGVCCCCCCFDIIFFCLKNKKITWLFPQLQYISLRPKERKKESCDLIGSVCVKWKKRRKKINKMLSIVTTANEKRDNKIF